MGMQLAGRLDIEGFVDTNIRMRNSGERLIPACSRRLVFD